LKNGDLIDCDFDRGFLSDTIYLAKRSDKNRFGLKDSGEALPGSSLATIEIHTGDDGTDSDPYLTLITDRGKTETIFLEEYFKKAETQFEKNEIDVIVHEYEKDFSSINAIELEVVKDGVNPDWQLDEILITYRFKTYRFACNYKYETDVDKEKKVFTLESVASVN